MIATPAIRNLIREGKVHQIYSSMQAGGRYGMRTMDQALASLVMAGRISWELGLQRCHDPQELARLTGRRIAGAEDA
jgi:twitching motility protein PilT